MFGSSRNGQIQASLHESKGISAGGSQRGGMAVYLSQTKRQCCANVRGLPLKITVKRALFTLLSVKLADSDSSDSVWSAKIIKKRNVDQYSLDL
jgi:hypothetical protein